MRRAVCFAILLLGCGDHHSAPPGVVYDDCTASEPVYDEAYTNLRAAQEQGREVDDPARAPTLTAPAEGETLPASGAAPTFRWTYPGTTRLAGPKDVRAHGCTVTGDVFWMRLALPGAETLHVLNLNTDWPVDEATWTKLRATGGQPIRAVLVGARMQSNRIIDGPFRANERTFTVR